MVVCPVCTHVYPHEPVKDTKVSCDRCSSSFFIIEFQGVLISNLDCNHQHIPAIYVDLDGTLAEFQDWKGIQFIGPPIARMLQKIFIYLDEGYRVKIFTARANIPESIPYIKDWLAQFGLGDLEVTNIKGFDMVKLYDDRAISVIPNKGPVHLF